MLQRRAEQRAGAMFHQSEELTCPQCPFTSLDLTRFCQHLRRHESAPTFRIRCPFCLVAPMTSVKYWRLHVLKHKTGSVASQLEADMTFDTVTTPSMDLSEGNAASVQTSVPSGSEDPLSGVSGPADYQSGPSGSTGIRSEPSCSLESVDSFVLRLRSKNVTEKTCRDILEYMESFTKEAIKEHSELDEVRPGQEPHCLQTLNDTLKSTRLDQHALRKCNLTTPRTIALCADAGGKVDTYEYVPLIPQLKQLCQNEDLLLLASDDDTELQGICDGAMHKGSAKNTMHLSVYYDGFQIGNPLSSKANDSKIGAVYCVINNLKGGIQMKRIMLLMTFYEDLLKKHSWAQLLEPLIEELSELESEGLCLESGTTVPVRLAAVLGDNLGVHSIGGFSTAFNGGAMMCRHCLGAKEDIQHKTAETDFQLRTQEEYAAKMRLLEDSEFDERMCLAFGIMRPCPFDSLREFHCMTSMPPDIMHDLLEGVVPSTISLVASKLIEDNIVSLEDLNKSIRVFPYVRLDVNHPGALRRDGRRIVVRGKASELWCLLRLFPLILLLAGVPGAVLSRNTCIQLVSKLIGIVLLAVAFTISQAEATALHSKVEEFLSDLRNVFPSFKLTPKYHYMLHYREQTLRHGPLRYLKDLDGIAGDFAEQFPGFGLGLNLSARLKFVKESLRNKFKNSRKRSVCEEVTSKKKKTCSLVNYLPAKSRNIVEVESIVRRMKDEGSSMDKAEVAKAMSDTLADRRHRLIGSRKQALKALLNRYPLLISESQLWAELARLHGDASPDGGDQLFQESLKKFNEILMRLQQMVGCAPEEAAAHLLAMFQEEDAVFTDSPAHGTPVICDGSIFVEGLEVCKLRSTQTADQILTWGASFAVYAQKPNRKIENTTCVLLRFVLGTDQGKVPKKLESIPVLCKEK